jgi:hypothetical protein
VRCRFAGEVAGVELSDGGLEIVGVEHDYRRDLIVRVDFDDAQRIRAELRGPAIVARSAREDEALPTGCDDDGRQVRTQPGVDDRPQVCDLAISTASDPGVYHPPAIVGNDVVGQYLRERIPVAGGEVRHVALARLASRVVQPPHLAVCLLFKPGMRGVEFSDRGFHVLDVEPHLQCDSTRLVDAAHLE